MKIPVLKIRDKDGKFIPINAIRGRSAYEQAKDGGYTGTEAEFIALLNGVTSSGEATHYSNLKNPHQVTKEQVGLGDVPNVTTNDQTPTYEEAKDLEQLTSGEKLAVALGKIKRAIKVLISHLSEEENIHQSAHNRSLGYGGALGLGARAEDGGAMGRSAYTDSGGSSGFEAYSFSGGAMGNSAYTDSGGAVGAWATAGLGFAGGAHAKTVAIDDEYVPIDAIQLGTGTNYLKKTLQVYDFQLMDEEGVIPYARMSPHKPTGMYKGNNDNPTRAINIIQDYGVGEILLIFSSANDIAFVSDSGARVLGGSPTASYVLSEDKVQFRDGYLYLKNCTHVGLNQGGVHYYWQVL